MTALNILSFKGFSLRPAGEADLPLAERWTAWDPDHAGKIAPKFWLEQRMGVDSVLVHDGKGPVFFFKVRLLVKPGQTNCPEPLPSHMIGLSEETLREVYGQRDRIAAEVFVQFMPCATEEDRERTRAALTLGMEWIEPVLEAGGAEEIFFDSSNEKLIAFCVKRLGFDTPEGKSLGKYYVAAANGQPPPRLRLRKKLRPVAAAAV